MNQNKSHCVNSTTNDTTTTCQNRIEAYKSFDFEKMTDEQVTQTIEYLMDQVS